MKAIALFSGGLDSRLAIKLMLEQGIEVHALHFSSVFHPGKERTDGRTGAQVAADEVFHIPITRQDVTDELLSLVKDPPHGYGSGMNPCIDCRIMQLKRARAMMKEVGASFVVTGEVLGQRPMSQRRGAIQIIEGAADMVGLVLRPLCAHGMEPTIAEEEGWVDRSKLKDFRGRQRTPQIALAAELDVGDYPNPAGGCRLTDPGFVVRARDLLEHDELSVSNLQLLRAGRQFRVAPDAKVAVGRNLQDNERIEELAEDGDYLLMARDFNGPTSLARGAFDEERLHAAARLTARYGQGRAEEAVAIAVTGPQQMELVVPPATDDELARWRV